MTEDAAAIPEPAHPADIRHEYARGAALIASLQMRLAEIRDACGGTEPVGFCELCGAALFPADRPGADRFGGLVCGPETEAPDHRAPCYWRPNRGDGA